MLVPYTEEYNKSLTERKGRGVRAYADYTLQTRKAFKVVVQDLIENSKLGISSKSKNEAVGKDNGDKEDLNASGEDKDVIEEQPEETDAEDDISYIKEAIQELYEQLKEKYSEGTQDEEEVEITMNDIADELAEYGLNGTFREVCVLFEDLGLDLDGKINTKEYKEELLQDEEINSEEAKEENSYISGQEEEAQEEQEEGDLDEEDQDRSKKK